METNEIESIYKIPEDDGRLLSTNENDDIEGLVFNESYKDWPFRPDDWIISHIFNRPEIMNMILTIKNYKFNQLSSLIYDIYTEVEKIRINMEEQDVNFKKKKIFLLKAEKDGNKNIQIPLENEYRLKKYVTLYKIYEFIGWFSKLRGETNIFKLCILEKQKLIEKIMPIADLSIRKVIGAKVVSRKHDQFEDAVSNAWVAIINFMPKIDPSRVMFSVFVSIANKSSYFYMARHLKQVYNNVQLSVLEDKMNQSDDIDGEFFLSSVVNKNEGITAKSYEDGIIDQMNENDKIHPEENEEMSILYNVSEADIEDVIRNTIVEDDEENFLKNFEGGSRKNAIEQKILSYSFTILSGKIRKMCFAKIYAEFFIDLIDQKISEKVINKYANLFINVMNFDDLSGINKDNAEINEALVKMLKNWIKSKQEQKLKENVTKVNKYSKKVEREQQVYEYLRDNNKLALSELLEFRKNCILFKID